MTIAEQVIKYEQGELSPAEQLAMFADLIHSGIVWGLQGHYGRVAENLIKAGYVSADGHITPLGELQVQEKW